MTISSTPPITTYTHLSLPLEIWRYRIIIPFLGLSEIVSFFFQTCQFFREIRFDIVRPIAEAERELMQITPYQGLYVTLERITSVLLRLPSAALRSMRSSLAAHPPIIYASQYANASVLLNEQLIALHGEDGLLSPRRAPSDAAHPDVFAFYTNLFIDDLIGAENSITRACLIARTILDSDRAADRFSDIAWRGIPLYPRRYGRLRNEAAEARLREQAQIVLSHVPPAMRDRVYFYLARASYRTGGTLALEYAHQIADNDLREKILGEIAENDRLISKYSHISENKRSSRNDRRIRKAIKSHDPNDVPFIRSRAFSEFYWKTLKASSISKVCEKSIKKINLRGWNPLDRRTEKCAEVTLKRKHSGSDSDDDDSRPAKIIKVSNSGTQ